MARRKKQNDDQNQDNLDPTDDTFGLPEIEYEPLKRDAPDEPIEETVVKETVTETTFIQPEPIQETPKQPEPRKFEYVEDNQFYEPEEEESPSIWPKILGLILVLAIAGGVIWYFVSYRPKQLAKETRERRELLANQEEERKKELARQEEERLAAEKLKAATQEPAKPPAGTILTLTGRSGLYYVVVASSIDGDLVMDYAKKLSKKGVTSKIIPPFGKSKFHRLAVAEGDTYVNAQATADGMKGGDYGDKVWVVKY